ncbi:unnamed protein product [Didymodactylos carnosus]|uniref:Uncharacterized protein n=1 Tax=Didymodactylos carnosus TaxID=1234261 RepID=A0A8S2CQP6_9BILA|nr:unnamed protein product [Didymodactylos carnosus]CAF3560756.1 unnamed protein product [Didymodactylos carnosus]
MCARELIRMIRPLQVVLVQTKYYPINEMSADQIFGNRSYNALIAKGPVIGLEFAGAGSIVICQQSINSLILSKYVNTPYFVSQNSLDAIQQLEKFYNFASMEFGFKLPVIVVGCEVNSTAIDKTTILHFAAAQLNFKICDTLIRFSNGNIHVRDYLD